MGWVQFIATYPSHKVDFFFSNYPYLLANAIIWGFYYLCPVSRTDSVVLVTFLRGGTERKDSSKLTLTNMLLAAYRRP